MQFFLVGFRLMGFFLVEYCLVIGPLRHSPLKKERMLSYYACRLSSQCTSFEQTSRTESYRNRQNFYNLAIFETNFSSILIKKIE